MTYYKIQVLTARDVHNPGTKRQMSGNEYIHSVIIHVSGEDSSWLPFEEAKSGAISFIRKFCDNRTLNRDETGRSNRKLERLENLTEKEMLSQMKPGQKIFNL